MKKVMIGLFAVLLSGMLAACGTQQGNSSGNDVPAVDPEQQQVENQGDDGQEEEPIDLTWYTEDYTAICDGVFFVGKDIKGDSYILTCTDSSWAMEITVFESEEQYSNYHKTSRFTVGEESDAKAQYALIDTTIWPDETYSLNIQDGYVLKIENGHRTLESTSGVATPAKSNNGKTRKIMDGLYLSKDLPRDSYMITCTKTDYAMGIIIFKDKDAYNQYSQADRFTVGEEQNAIEQYALSDMYIYYGDTAYVNLTDDMVMLVKAGSGTMEPVLMNWAG